VKVLDRYRPGGADDAADVTVAFLKKLRPSGPWVLSAIMPDGPITTVTAASANEARAFIREHDGRRNLYFSVNPTREAMTNKAKKTDIAAIEFLFGDFDPRDDETPEQAKARYLAEVDALGRRRPTACVDSGNGLQVLWRLQAPIALNANATDTAEIIADIESRTKALMLNLGTKAGTQNVDRILRLPGTVNLPNKVKRKAGRAECKTALLWFEDTTHPLSAFSPEPEGTSSKGERARHHGAPKGGQPASGDEDDLARTIRDGGEERHGPTRSDAVWWVVNEMFSRGYVAETIVKVLLDEGNGISDHVRDQRAPQDYAARQVAKARAQIEFAADDKNVPYKGSPDNVNVALLKMGVTLRYDEFADRILIAGLEGFGPCLEDAAVNRLWLTVGRRFRLNPSETLFLKVIMNSARLNGFHPVRDYLDALAWDGVERIDTWLHDYAQAEDSDYTSAVGALMLTAAVRRVRRPGCKFDEMVVLENAEQGTNKSTALAVLAVKDEWFTDDLPLNAEGKRVIEALRGKWIIEAAELSGMRRTDIEHVKALLSRQFDRGRLAYDRIVSEVPRQCVVIGTTNATEYLKDTSGNRRFWPVLCERFDIKSLRRDRDQLWAEAAAREAEGISIRLPRDLWDSAGAEQAKRLTNDPFRETLQHHLGDRTGKISAETLWEIMEVKAGQRGQDQSRRIADAMRSLGWRRNRAGTVTIDGRKVAGWFKGDQPWNLIRSGRDEQGKMFLADTED
jgi:hypothetical protein